MLQISLLGSQRDVLGRGIMGLGRGIVGPRGGITGGGMGTMVTVEVRVLVDGLIVALENLDVA